MRGVNSGFSIKRNGIVEIRIECNVTELAKCVQVLQLADRDIKAYAVVNGERSKLGTFRFYGLHIDRDGESKLVFQSEMDNVNASAIAALYQEQENVMFGLVA